MVLKCRRGSRGCPVIGNADIARLDTHIPARLHDDGERLVNIVNDMDIAAPEHRVREAGEKFIINTAFSALAANFLVHDDHGPVLRGAYALEARDHGRDDFLNRTRAAGQNDFGVRFLQLFDTPVNIRMDADLVDPVGQTFCAARVFVLIADDAVERAFFAGWMRVRGRRRSRR